jgi:hypothetical protein
MKFIFLLTITFFFFSKLFTSENDCGAFFIKKGVAASFPILKKEMSGSGIKSPSRVRMDCGNWILSEQ